MITYLASPYHHERPEMMRWRWLAINMVAAQLIPNNRKRSFYCPISMLHPVHTSHGKLFETHEQAMDFDLPFMEVANDLWVVDLPGWEKSVGVKFEIGYFTAHKKPIQHIDPKPHLLPALFKDLAG